MKLKIPPVIVMFVTAIAMWSLNYLTKEWLSFSFEGQQLVSRILFGLCMVSVLAGIYAFVKLKTTVDPMNPDQASKLVTIGVYHLTRNPMYLGMLLLICGWAIKLGNPLNVLCLSFFVWFMTRFQIKPEEAALIKNFGADYEEYRKKVRRWI